MRQELSPFPSKQDILHLGGYFKSGGTKCFKSSVSPPDSTSYSRVVTCRVLVASRGWWL